MSNVRLRTNQIEVFPASNKPATVNSKFTTEYNLTNIINRLTDYKNFIISPSLSDAIVSIDNIPICFNIQGYFIKINTQDFINNFSSDTDIYAYINYKSEVNSVLDGEYVEDSLDTNPYYNGVQLSSNIESIDPQHVLKILYRDSTSDSWKIPRDSYFKLNQSSIYIDDGII